MNEVNVVNGEFVERQLPVLHVNSEQLIRTARACLESARLVIVDGEEMLDVGREELAALKAQRDAIEEARKERTRPLDAAKSELMDEVRPTLAIYDEAIGVVRGALDTYARKVAAAQAEAQRKANELARQERERQERLAREERERAAAEQLRVKQAEEETRRRDEEAKKLREDAERAADAGDLAAADKARDEARQAEQAANAAAAAAQEAAQAAAKASAASQEALTAPPAVLPVVPAKASGTRGAWKAECYDPAAFFQYCATRPELRNLWKLDTTALNAEAKARRELLNYPGVRSYEDISVTAKRK